MLIFLVLDASTFSRRVGLVEVSDLSTQAKDLGRGKKFKSREMWLWQAAWYRLHPPFMNLNFGDILTLLKDDTFGQQ